MYTAQDLHSITAQKNRRIILLLLPCALLTAGIIVSLMYRMQWLTALLTALMCCLLLFCITMFIRPLVLYARHVQHALYGKTRETTGCLKSVEETAIDREGLLLHPLIININRMENEEDDRLFYWDGRLPLPDWQPGQKITLTSYDKLITGWNAE